MSSSTRRPQHKPEVPWSSDTVGWQGRLARKPGSGGHRGSRNSNKKRRCRGHGAQTRSRTNITRLCRTGQLCKYNKYLYVQNNETSLFPPQLKALAQRTKSTFSLHRLCLGTVLINYRIFEYRYVGRSGLV